MRRKEGTQQPRVVILAANFGLAKLVARTCGLVGQQWVYPETEQALRGISGESGWNYLRHESAATRTDDGRLMTILSHAKVDPISFAQARAMGYSEPTG